MTTNTAQVSPPVRRLHRQLIGDIKKTVNYNDAGISAGLAFDNSLPQGAFIMQILCEIVTVFNAGSTNVLTIGTNSPGYTDIAGAGDINEASATVQAVTTGLGRSICASADKAVFALYAQTGTAATTGQAVIVISYEGGWTS